MTIEIALPVSLTMETVEDFFATLRALEMKDNECVALNASQTEVITTPGVQLLLAWEQSLQQRNIPLSLINPTPGFTENCRILGVSGRLNKWSGGHETQK